VKAQPNKEKGFISPMKVETELNLFLLPLKITLKKI
jgi:hypothetical protein